MTINKNFESRPERRKYSKIIYENLELDFGLKSLFMVTGAYKKVSYCMILREREATAVHFTRAVDDESARFRLRLFFFCVSIML